MKRILALTLAAALVLAGCGSKQAGSNTPAKATEAALNTVVTDMKSVV